jgi:hypothetical protein
MIGLNGQALRDQLNRHLCGAGKNLVERAGRPSCVIHDDDGNTRLGRQMF